MEVFTIVANEVIGLSATECTLIQFSNGLSSGLFTERRAC